MCCEPSAMLGVSLTITLTPQPENCILTFKMKKRGLDMFCLAWDQAKG